MLIEHKSYRDKYTPLQIGSYLYSGYLQQVKQGSKQLSPIIPVLFYHGKQKWEYHTSAELFGDLQKELLPYIPDFQYIYHNLPELPDKDLRGLENRFLAASLLILKYSFDKDWLQGNFTAVLSIGLAEGSHDLKQALLLYFLGRMELPEEQVKQVIQELPSSIQEDVMSTYELILEKGRMEERARLERLLQEERARAEAELARAVEAEKQAEKLKSAKRMLQSNFNVQIVADILEIPVEQVEKLK
ncbi:Rpn family recombination-promoting nuclease/putative transposase [Desertivirga brevis]|uniref:Rpn family recombination-promoting nuclease/putative transposase n=1 Tax=Desertivirga brevis TaxID=2810310 RepID=UPI001A962E5D|nr:Rpn family recombination-promoting nuclease/putative transposase [Pedobacter sp. SYSU D00873]